MEALVRLSTSLQMLVGVMLMHVLHSHEPQMAAMLSKPGKHAYIASYPLLKPKP